MLFLAALGAQAASANTSFSYAYSSDYNQARAGASVPLGINAAIGLEGRYVEDKFSLENGAFADPVYSIYLPIRLDLDLVKFHITPFYYFENKSDNPAFQDNSAYGIKAQLVTDLVQDEVNQLFTTAYLGVSYANQKGSLLQDGGWEDENYAQMAYTLGFLQNFFGTFVFQAAATAYQYPDGIDGVEYFRAIMDQNDLAFTQSYDVNRALGKYVLSARISRLWPEKRSSLYVGYHFAEFYTAQAQHSFLLGNTFYVTANAYVDAAYNHLQNTDGKNKRDIFFINLNIAF